MTIIDEKMAETAHRNMSMRDYVPGSATAEYESMCAEARGLADAAIARAPHRAEEVERIYRRYCEKAAWYINEDNRIGCMCVSLLVAGPSNFPTKKKERQVRAWDNLHKQFGMFDEMKRELRRVGTAGEPVKSGDADALERLRAKLEARERDQERMKAANAWYRKRGTLKGCPGVSDETAERMDADLADPDKSYLGRAPYPSWMLSNNNAEIRRLRKRMADLEAAKAAPPAGAVARTVCGEPCEVVEDADIMRLQLRFDGKPGDECRRELKANGFRWAPSQGAWQRQLTDNARRALARLAA